MSDKVYCYPDSSVLRNKFNITDGDEFLKVETECASIRLLELQMHPVQGKFDFKHLCAIHRRIFQDIFTWAGKPRTVDIAKGNLFCRAQFIDSYAQDVFSAYFRDCESVKDNETEFIHRFAYHYADLNALHPFREGNGRSQREFARELCYKCGYIFDVTVTNHEEMVNASIQSFNGDIKGLEHIFSRAVKRKY